MAKKEPKLKDGVKPATPDDQAKIKSWEVISKEYAINEEGNRSLSKEVYQLRREFLLKIISSSAVIIAFAGLVLNLWYQRKQNDFQIAQQRALAQFAIYTKCMANLNILANSQEIDSTFLKAERALEFENYPQIMLLGNDRIAGKFNDLINLAYFYRRIHNIRDTIYSVGYFETQSRARIYPLEKKDYNLLKKSQRKLADFNAQTSKDRHIYYKRANYLNMVFRETDSNKMNAVLKLLPQLKQSKAIIKSICDNSSNVAVDITETVDSCLKDEMDYYDTGKWRFRKGQDYYGDKFDNDDEILGDDLEKLDKIMVICRVEMNRNRMSILSLMIKTNLLLKDNL